MFRNLLEEFGARLAAFEMVLMRYHVGEAVRLRLDHASKRGKSERRLMDQKSHDAYRLRRYARDVHLCRIQKILELVRPLVGGKTERFCNHHSLFDFSILERKKPPDANDGNAKYNKSEQ